MINISWSPEAKADLAEIHNYYRAVAPDFASRAVRSVLLAVERLSENPRLGSGIGLGDVRKWSVTKTPLILLYRVSGSELQIVRLHHARENWKPEA